jgi:hypothetical protein
MLFQQDSWRTAMQDVTAAIDETMGELVLVTPATVTRPNFPSVPQPEKAVTVVAVYTAKSKQVFGTPNTKRGVGDSGLSVGIETSEPVFSFAIGALPFPLYQHYRITRLCSGEVFEITAPKPDYVSRVVCKVVRLGREPEQP